MTADVTNQLHSLALPLSTPEFFVAGGTLRRDSPSYVERPADDELYRLILDGKFCYLLTARQMGKSSLMVRTSRRLAEGGTRTAIIDLTKIGSGVSVEQWYLGLLRSLETQLSIATDAQEWWGLHPSLSPVQRFIAFLSDIVLVQIDTSVTIFIDEIDSTLSLPFSDDFFAAIRAVYNERATNPIYERLTFVLLGVATPSDLMKDRSRTPFNIGQAIDLHEFSRQDAQILRDALLSFNPEEGPFIFDRIFYWTNGHPYLTQKLCLSVAESNHTNWDVDKIDGLVEKLFLSEAARSETNLQFIRDKIATHPLKRSLLTLYGQVYSGKKITEDERSISQSQLKLFGLVQSENRVLQIRNQIYQQAFNQAWIKSVMPVNWTRRIAIAAMMAVVIVSAILLYTLLQEEQRTDEVLAQQAITTFNSQRNATLRLNSLSELMALDTYGDETRTLFGNLPPTEQLTLFSNETIDLPQQRQRVIQGTYIILDDTQANNRLLRAMHASINSEEDTDSQMLAASLEKWINGREAYQQQRYGEAIAAYNEALKLSSFNPGVYFDRGRAYQAEKIYEAALTDFNAALSLSLDDDVLDFWRERIMTLIIKDADLHAAWWRQRADYPALTSLVATPTSTPSPTFTPTLTPTQTATSTSAPSRTPSRTATSTSTPLTPTPIPTIRPTNAVTPQPTVQPSSTPVPPTAVPPTQPPAAPAPTDTPAPAPTDPPSGPPTREPTPTP